MELHGERVVLRPLRVDDAPRFAEPGADPEVARWWPGMVGFCRVGVMRKYQREPDGTWSDGVLLDLLARELDD